MNFFNNKNRLTSISLLTVLSLFAMSFVPVYADRQSDLKGLNDKYASASTSQDDKAKIQVEMDMLERQIAVDDSYANIESRVKAMITNDPRKDSAKAPLNAAKTAKDAFVNLSATDKTYPNFMKIGDSDVLADPYTSSDAFNKAEKDAINAISAVNRELLAPSRPGNVPAGDVINDFIPGLIRLLFRFASLAVLVSFIVSGTYFVIAFSNEERVTKAKHMLYYSLIGFVFVVLAFAIVKAVTNINFFGII